MKFTLPIGFIGAFHMLLGLTAQAQQSINYAPLQFSENKGQWDKEVRFKTDLGGPTIYLRNNGFTFFLVDQKDMAQLHDYFHGHVDMKGLDTGAAAARAAIQPLTATVSDNGGIRPPRLPQVKGHAYKVTFAGASPNAQLIPEKPAEEKSNYFIGDDPSKWASDVQSFQRIQYKDLYPGIDAVVYSEASTLKYDLMLQPGADPGKIALDYEGITGLTIKKSQLYIRTSVGEVVERMPVAYQYINNIRVPVKVSYVLKGNRLGFKLGNYDPQFPLVIDPSYDFSTVSGSRSDNWGFTATYDDGGNFYGGGIVFGTGYPVTPGAVQSSFGGSTFDIGISKFSPDGRRLIYATYVGGSGLDQPHSLFVDKRGNLVISGRTTSSDFPRTNVRGPRGGWDIAVVKLNATGSAIIGGVIVAGSSNDGVNISDQREGGARVLLRNYGDDARSEVVIDDAGYIYVASCTNSSDFYKTPGSFQQTFGGVQDGVVMKINPLCSDVVWSSYLGGSKEDASYVLALNGLNTLFVAGGTASDNFPVSAGVVYPRYRGGICDGFITHIANDGSKILASTYLGANNLAADQVYGIQLDQKGNVYVMGTTDGNWPIKQPAGTPTFFNNNSTQFITKLTNGLDQLIYSTTFGKNTTTPSISPVAFLVDRCENVYVSGWGGGINTSTRYPNSNTRGLPIKDPLQSSSDGADFYFFVLKKDATDILFGSYFGGIGLYEHVDGGTSRFDRNGVIYQGICAWCNVSRDGGKPRYPTTPGAYATSPPPYCNMGALKISFNFDGVKAGVKTLDRRKNYCVPADIIFVDTTGRPAEQWIWNFGDGTAEQTTTKDTSNVHRYTRTGTYRIRLIKIDANACNGRDTAYVEVKIGDNPATLDFSAERLPPCESLTYRFINNSVANGKPFDDNSFIFDLGDGTPPQYVGPGKFPFVHKFPQPGIYPVTLTLVDTFYCNAPQVSSVPPLRVAKDVKAQFESEDTVCTGTDVKFNNTTLGGEHFTWYFPDDNTTTSDPYPTHRFNRAGRWAIKLVAIDENTCNKKDSITKIIVVSDPPVADFTFSPTKPIENTPVQFTNTSIGAISYTWDFGDGDTTSQVNPSHQYNRTNTYNVCLYAKNDVGCVATKCEEVSAIVVPNFDVPTAFSPNNDGMNDVFYVKAFGITRFNLKIFNRQGQLVFESTDPRIGWDGRFKGTLQPMDAYAFVVNIEFTDGTKGNRSGSVTLLR